MTEPLPRSTTAAGLMNVGDGLLLGEVGGRPSGRAPCATCGVARSAARAKPGDEQAWAREKANRAESTVHGAPVLRGALQGGRRPWFIAGRGKQRDSNRDIQAHNLALYQLSYARMRGAAWAASGALSSTRAVRGSARRLGLGVDCPWRRGILVNINNLRVLYGQSGGEKTGS